MMMENVPALQEQENVKIICVWVLTNGATNTPIVETCPMSLPRATRVSENFLWHVLINFVMVSETVQISQALMEKRFFGKEYITWG